jgi:serine/threonine protein kinase
MERSLKQARLSYQEAQAVLSDVTKGIVQVHAQHIIHGDLKPDNVLCFRLSDGTMRFKVVDLGGAKKPDKIYGLARVGAVTFAYAAPEQLGSRRNMVDMRVDSWQLGAMLMALRSGENPFKHCLVGQERDWVEMKRRGQYMAELHSFEESFLSCCVTGVEARWAAGRLLKDHPYLQ